MTNFNSISTDDMDCQSVNDENPAYDLKSIGTTENVTKKITLILLNDLC
jgi:hypothetical protein